MFERFLHARPPEESENTDTPVPVAPVPRTEMPKPAAMTLPSAQPDVQQNPLPEVRPQPMSDALDPNAKPPMANHPILPEELPSVVRPEADQSALDLPDLPDEEENPETALPVDELPENKVENPPEPPSFLKTEAPQKVENAKVFIPSDETPVGSVTPVAPKSSIEFKEHFEKDAIHEIKTVRGDSLHNVDFADIWFTPEGVAYVRDKDTRFALTPIETDDLDEFHTVLEQGFTGMSSYAVRFAGDSYRVERVNTADGLQYNCRKMPTTTPEIETLGFAPSVVKHLTSLSRSSGLLLFAGPTGQGKTTTVSALMKRFLDTDGGFLYTIEDPPEMPLSGVYHSKNGGLGLCKQVPVENDQWGAGLRSALRSKPRYILVGEIRTPETASQCLVAATSGHLVLSTIHANGVEDALNSIIKYAASTGLDNSLVADLLARGILGVVHQRLEGTTKLKLVYQSAFANPNAQAADQMRMAIRDANINLATFMEQQKTRMERGLPMFRE